MVVRGKNATVVVLGDIGRSPRMCFHAKSLADKSYRVQIVGYADTLPHPAIAEHPMISIVPLRAPPACLGRLRPAFALILKFLWTLAALLFALFFRVDWPLLVLMQNPPGVPCMFACWLAARLHRAQFVIDWHNYSYAMLRESYHVDELRIERMSERRAAAFPVDDSSSGGGMGSGDVRGRRLTKVERAAQAAAAVANKKKRSSEKKKKVSLIQRFVEQTYNWEGFFGRRADLNLCVSHAMRQDMYDAWGIRSATLYDRPPAWTFRRLNEEERHSFYYRLASLGSDFRVFAVDDSKVALLDDDATEVTRFSYRDSDGAAQLRPDRPLLLLSSTSWTEDEDFGLLLDALREFDSVARLSTKSNVQTRLPHLVCVITGRGPLRTHYMSRIEHMQMQNVEVITPWLEPTDYPLMLGSADLGVSLHTSTSGLDLPMKVVDMFGCGLPAVAKRFPCIGELVSDGHNGRLFDTSHELSQIIKSLSCGFPLHSQQLSSLASNLESDAFISWDKNWDACVWPLISPYGAPPSDELARRQRFAVTDISSVISSSSSSPQPSQIEPRAPANEPQRDAEDLDDDVLDEKAVDVEKSSVAEEIEEKLNDQTEPDFPTVSIADESQATLLVQESGKNGQKKEDDVAVVVPEDEDNSPGGVLEKKEDPASGVVLKENEVTNQITEEKGDVANVAAEKEEDVARGVALKEEEADVEHITEAVDLEPEVGDTASEAPVKTVEKKEESHSEEAKETSAEEEMDSSEV